jgi:hypothetical protein
VNHRAKKAINLHTAVQDTKMVTLMSGRHGILHLGYAGAGAGDALPTRAAGVTAAGRPASQL